MIDPEELASGTEVSHFSMMFEKLIIDGNDTGPAEIPARYNGDWRTVLNLSSILADGPNEVLSSRSKIDARLAGAKEDISILVTRISLGGSPTSRQAEGRTTKEPIVSGPALDSKEFLAVLLSSPERYGKTICLEDHNSNKFEIRSPTGTSGDKKVLTSNLSLTASEPLAKLQTFLAFLTFVKGSYCGLGNLRASDGNGNLSFDLIGFTRNDVAKHQTNWFDIEINESLKEIFLLFSKTMDSQPTQKALFQAIEFYRAANVTRTSSLEMSIIAAHSGLEALTNFVLEYLAGWSSALVDNRTIAFSDKLRAACGFFEFHGSALQNLPELRKRSVARNNADLFELISLFRNKVVHQDLKFTTNGTELHEVWTLAQWLLEVLIFGIIGYRGVMIDRRVYTGWRGTTCEVPLRR